MISTLDELSDVEERHAFNVSRWKAACVDPKLDALGYRIETDAFGRILLGLPGFPEHYDCQEEIARWLHRLLPDGQIQFSTALSTSGGVKAIDVSWISRSRYGVQDDSLPVFDVAPEICVEVICEANLRSEILEKRDLYFESGAEEVWLCGTTGRIECFLRENPNQINKSQLCPDFPWWIEIGGD